MIDIVIYSKDNCTYCEQAKNLLKINDLEFRELKLNEDFSRDEILELFPTARTFPIIVINNTYIGGYSQLTTEMEHGIDNLGKTVILG